MRDANAHWTYLTWMKRIPLIALSMSSTDSIDGGWMWIGGKSAVILPLLHMMSFIFFCRTTACCVKCRRQPDDSCVFSWFSPNYTETNGKRHSLFSFQQTNKSNLVTGLIIVKWSYLLLVNGVGLLLAVERRTEITHTALCTGDQVVT